MTKVEDSELLRMIVNRYSQLGEIRAVVESDMRRIIAWARAHEGPVSPCEHHQQAGDPYKLNDEIVAAIFGGSVAEAQYYSVADAIREAEKLRKFYRNRNPSPEIPSHEARCEHGACVSHCLNLAWSRVQRWGPRLESQNAEPAAFPGGAVYFSGPNTEPDERREADRRRLKAESHENYEHVSPDLEPSWVRKDK